MVTEVKTIYRCEHCRKIYFRKHACEKHETRCSKNPFNQRPCFECKHLCKKDAYFENDFTGKEYSYPLLFCKARDHFVYPPITSHKGNALDPGDCLNEPMPTSCKLFESNSILSKDLTVPFES